MHRRTAGQYTPPMTACGSVAASGGSEMFTTDHCFFDQVSMTGCCVAKASSCEPTAKHRVTDGHDTASRVSTLEPAATGAAIAVHVLPDHLRSSPYWTLAESYWPTAVHQVADGHDMPFTMASGFGSALAGNGAVTADHVPPDKVSSIPLLFPGFCR